MSENEESFVERHSMDDDSDFELNIRNERDSARIFSEILDQTNQTNRSISPIPGPTRNIAESVNDSPRRLRPVRPRPLVVSSNDGPVSERVVRWTYDAPDNARVDDPSTFIDEEWRLQIPLPRIPRSPYMPPKIFESKNKIPVLHFGNRSFQPTAKFNDVPKAYPAKPGIEGFSPCHEKAMAAFSVYNSIQHENDSDEEDLANHADVFSHFWLETSVVQTQGQQDTNSPRFGSEDASVFASSPTRNISLNSSPQQTTNQNEQSIPQLAYDQWDRETSSLNNPLNYDLWNEFPEPSSSSSRPSTNRDGTRSSTVGMGTNDLNSESVGQQTDMVDDQSTGNNIQTSYSTGNARTSDFHHLIRQRLRRNGFSSERNEEASFEHDIDPCDDEVSRMFSLDFPVPPSVMDPRMPRSFLEDAYSRGENNPNNIRFLLSDSSDSDSAPNEDENEFEGDSIFPRVPEADNTPSSLLNDLRHELENPSSTSFINEQIENILTLLEHDDNEFPHSGPSFINFSDLDYFTSMDNEGAISPDKTEDQTRTTILQNSDESSDRSNSNDSEVDICKLTTKDLQDTDVSNKCEEISEDSNFDKNSIGPQF